MDKPRRKRMYCSIMLLGALVLAAGVASANPPVFDQPFAGTGNLYASQNDTAGGYGNFATLYDNFKLSTTTNITGLSWAGGYYFSGQGTITGFTLTFWSDNAGQPGSALASTTIAGNASETLLGQYAGYDDYSYAASLASPFTATAGTQYWLSIVPDTAYPPYWGWAQGTGGDGDSYQDYNGTRRLIDADMSFSAQEAPVPEPAFYQLGALLTLGGLGLLRMRRRA